MPPAFERVFDLPDDPRAAGLARAHTRAFLRGRALATLTDDAELLASELVTNVIRHAGGRPQLTLTKDASAVRIGVSDKGFGLPSLQAPDLDTLTGRGLFLVDRLSARWGFTREPDCSTVWCELAT
jgi:anti-sigma regulatory factor (Ser/Thr protein kinase)